MMSASDFSPATLLFRPGALGDTVLTLDAIEQLRRRYPGESIELVGNLDAGRLLARWGRVDRVSACDSAEVTGLFVNPPRVADRWRSARRVMLWLPRGEAIASGFQTVSTARVAWSPPEPQPGEAQHVADHLWASVAPL